MDEKKTQINTKNLTRFKFQKISILGILALLSFVIIPVYAAVPFDQFTFQGVLKDSGDNLVTATKDITLEIFTTLTGGTALWSETHDNISVSKGIFTVVAGSVTPFSSFLNFTDAYFLQVKFADSDGANQETLSPRIKITAAPYSLAASRASVDFDLNKKNLINATSLNSTAVEISQTGTSLAANITNTGTGDSFRVNDQPSDTSPFLIDSTGKVGIGDTTPDNLLDILSALGEAAIAITSTGTDTDAIINFELTDGTPTFVMGIDDSDLDKFKIGTSAIDTNTRVTIDSTGKVGIGTTTPTHTLNIVGDLNVTENLIVDTDTLFTDSINNRVGIRTNSPQYMLDMGINTFVSIEGLFGHIIQHNSASSQFWTLATRNNGNFGIGTSTTDPRPGGNIISSTNDKITITPSGNVGIQVSDAAIDLAIGDSDTGLEQISDGILTIVTNSGERMRISATGQIAFPSLAQLDSDDRQLCFKRTGGFVTGEVTFSGDASDCLSSSIRYKENIEDLEWGLDELMELRPVKFDYKKGGKESIGFIAEEVFETNLSWFVNFNDDKQIDSLKSKYFQVVAIKAIQEQQSQIEQLQAEIDELKSLVCLDHPNAMVCRR